EDDNVAALDVLERQDRIEDRSARAIDELVDKQMVADKQVVLHGRRRYLERLNDECCAEERKNDGDEDRFKILSRRGFFENGFSHIKLFPLAPPTPSRGLGGRQPARPPS